MKPAIDGLHHILCPQIEGCRVSRRKNQDRSPRRAILALIDFRIEGWYRPRSNILAETGPLVEAIDGAVSPAQIDDVRILGIRYQVSALAPTRGKPVPRRDLAVVRAA